MSVRVAVIGAGIMGADHARIFATEVAGVTLQAICDADGTRARQVADATGAAHAATDPLAVINDAQVDAVLIASPDATHAPLTLACIAAGKAVLCEKPLSQQGSECLEVVSAEVKRGKRCVQVGFMRRFDPSYVAMKQALASGQIGAALMMHNFHRNVSAPAGFTGQMAITNSAPHEFDIVRFVLETEYDTVSVFRPGSSGSVATGAPVFMVLRTTTGQLVTVEVNNNAAYGYDVRGELVGETGSFMLPQPASGILQSGLRSQTEFPADWRPRFAEAYRLQNAAWIKSIQSGSVAGASAWDGYAATLIAEAAVKSLEMGEPVKVSRAGKPALY